MVDLDLSTVFLVGGTGFAVSEATGLTNITGQNDSKEKDKNKRKSPTNIPIGRGNFPRIIREQVDLPVGGLPRGSSTPDLSFDIENPESSDGSSFPRDLFTTDIPDDGNDIDPFIDPSIPSDEGEDSGGTKNKSSKNKNDEFSDGFDLQDLAGDGKLGTAVATGGEIGSEAEQFVSENPIATLGTAGGVALAPFTGGTSLVVGAGLGGAGELSADALTGKGAFNDDKGSGGSSESRGADVSGSKVDPETQNELFGTNLPTEGTDGTDTKKKSSKNKKRSSSNISSDNSGGSSGGSGSDSSSGGSGGDSADLDGFDAEISVGEPKEIEETVQEESVNPVKRSI